MDWSQCPLVETDPLILSGSPVLQGTRMPVDAILDNFDYGVTVLEISQLFAVDPDEVRAILSYAESQRVVTSSC